MKNGDVNKLETLLHHELVFHIPNGQTITKEMDLETYRSKNINIKDIKSSDQKIKLIGDNAIVSVIIEMQGTYFDYSLDGKYKIIRIWKYQDKLWKVIAGSNIKLE